MSTIRTLPETGFLRIKHILGDPKNDIPALLPFCATTWWNGCKSGRFPKPHKISKGCTGWKVEDIKELIAKLSSEHGEETVQ